MKITEGYWLQSEKANTLYAVEAYEIKAIPKGLSVLATTRKVRERGDTLNLPTINVWFTSPLPNIIRVEARHFMGYQVHTAQFQLFETNEDVDIQITDTYAIMKTGEVSIKIYKGEWNYEFIVGGEILTTNSLKNLGYVRYGKDATTMAPGPEYMIEDYLPYMVNELSLQPGEYVYGFGERFTSFIKNGQIIETWNEDGGTSSQIAYKCIPFYMTNKGYGVFVQDTQNVSFEVASEKVSYVGFSVPGEQLTYNFIYGGTPKKIIEKYTELTGRPALPPAWSFGLWLSTSFTTDYDEKTALSFIDGMEKRNLPFSVFHFDCFWMKAFTWCDFEWDENTFSDVRGMIDRYKQKGIKINVWINPYVAQGTLFFKEGMDNRYFLLRRDGKGVKQVDWWQPGMAIVDFTNPEAKDWYTNKLKILLDYGVDAFKTDFGERIPIDVTYYNGATPESMHNYYTQIYNQTVFELLEKEKGKNQAVIFARSATAGGQKYPVHWGGDCSANYTSMAETLRGGLSLALSGFGFWSHDISGFEQTAKPDVYKRWVAFGMLSTHSRLHGSTSYRVPWLFDDESVDVLRHFTRIKHRLMPYLYAASLEAHHKGIPVMRPMMMEFVEDYTCQTLDMQYMLGGNLLCAPIFNEDGMAHYYLPKGRWTHLISNEVREGGQWYHEYFDYFSLPLYVKENSVLPLGGTSQKPEYNYLENMVLNIYEPLNNTPIEMKISSINQKETIRVKIEKQDENIIVEVDKVPLNCSAVIVNSEKYKEAIILMDKKTVL